MSDLMLDVDQVRPTTQHLIDCDIDPFIPDGWTVEQHQRGGQWMWNILHVSLHADSCHQDIPLNANVLDFLINNSHLIPTEWKGPCEWKPRCTFFPGTIYRTLGGNRCMRYLFWRDGRWAWNYAGSASIGTIAARRRA